MKTPAPAPQGQPQAGFNLSRWALQHRALMVYLIIILVLAGVLAGRRLPQSEDPPFTFRLMVVQTLWPGATADQVREQVTDVIERALQNMPHRDYLASYSRPGQSTIFYFVKEDLDPALVPAEWYQVRKTVGDMRQQLPVNVQGPFFDDEFGDVYTNIYALGGDGYTPAELHDQADAIRTVLLRVPGVAKVDYFSDPAERIEVRIPNAALAQSGVTPSQIQQAIAGQNAVANSGVLDASKDSVFVRPSGQFGNLQDLADTLIEAQGQVVRLGDLAEIQRGYADPPATQMRMGGKPVLGIGITAAEGYDVVALGARLQQAVAGLQARLPTGLTLQEATSMPRAISASVDEFLRSVGEAIVIVLAVSLLSLGLRTGMVVVISIPVVLAVTALLMDLFGIGLNKVSLGTLILALGLLVDDAIISVEMMAVKLEQGWDRVSAAAFAYTSTAFPMLTGTLVTVSGFLPIALARSNTGEYTRSIFQVSAISLLLSWLAAVILIPLLGHALLRPKIHTPSAPGEPSQPASAKPEPAPQAAAAGDESGHAHAPPAGNDPAPAEHDIYQSRFYQRLRASLHWCVRHRLLVALVTGLLFAAAMASFRFVPQQFFPDSSRPELLVDLRLRESASFQASLEQARRMETLLHGHAGVTRVVGFVGTGAPRFYLPLNEQLPAPNVAQFIVTAASIPERETLKTWLESTLQAQFPAVRGRVSRLESGPPVGYPVQFRVSGDDIPKVRGIAEQVAAVLNADGRARNVQFDWDEPSARASHFEVDQQAARRLGISSRDIADFLDMTLAGHPVSQYREGDRLIPIVLRAPAPERNDPQKLLNLAVPSPHGAIPLGALGSLRSTLEYAIIWERDRQPTLTVRADVAPGVEGIDFTHVIDARLKDIRASLPTGYRIVVGGAAENSSKAQSSINAEMPIMIVAVLTLLMIQLQRFSRVVLVVLTAPLGLVGVVAALLIFQQPFGFVAMLGMIAMFGIIMRNSVILVDQIEQDVGAGHRPIDAIVDAAVRRFRPIALTATAAVLALIPLLRSDFFGPMATALMGGITVATVLTIFVLPALYALMTRVRDDGEDPGPNAGGPPPSDPAGRGEPPGSPGSSDASHPSHASEASASPARLNIVRSRQDSPLQKNNCWKNRSRRNRCQPRTGHKKPVAGAGVCGSVKVRGRSALTLTMGILAALLAGCAFGPTGTPPAMPQPAHYTAEPLDHVQGPGPATEAADSRRTAGAALVTDRTGHTAGAVVGAASGTGNTPGAAIAAVGGTRSAPGAAPASAPLLLNAQQPAAQWWTRFGSSALDALVAEAMAGNPNLAAADARLAAAHQILAAQIGASTWPSLDVGAQAERERTLTVPVELPRFPKTALYSTFVGEAQVRYTFDIFGAIRHQNQALADRIEQQSDELQAARSALQANVVSGALTLSADSAQLQVLSAMETALQQNARDADRQQLLGSVPATTALDAHLQAETLATQIPALRARIQANRHALAVLLGRTPDQAPAVIPFEQWHMPASLPVLVPSALLAARPDIQAASAALQATAQDVGAATAELFPSLNLSATLGRGGFAWSSLFSPANTLWSIAGGIAAPLFHGGALLAQRKAQLQAYAAAQDDYRSTVLAAFKEVADSLASLDQATAGRASADAAYDAAQAIATETTRRATLGAVPLSSARSAQVQAGQSQLAALGEQSKQLLSAVRLFHAMGSVSQPEGTPSEGAPSESVPSEGAPSEGAPFEGAPSEGAPS